MKKCQYRVIEEFGLYKVQKLVNTISNSVIYEPIDEWVICYNKYSEAKFTNLALAIEFCKTKPSTSPSDNVVFEYEEE